MSRRAFLGGLAADVVVKKKNPAPGAAGHGDDLLRDPLVQFLVAVIVIELELHLPRAPAPGIAAMEPDVEKIRAGYHVQGGEEFGKGLAHPRPPGRPGVAPVRRRLCPRPRNGGETPRPGEDLPGRRKGRPGAADDPGCGRTRAEAGPGPLSAARTGAAGPCRRGTGPSPPGQAPASTSWVMVRVSLAAKENPGGAFCRWRSTAWARGIWYQV